MTAAPASGGIMLEKLAPVATLDPWLAEHVPELGEGPLSTGFLHGGTSNTILTVSRGALELVLRRTPEEPPPGAGKSIRREARVLTALHGSDVPHPRVYASCDDEQFIGSPFYVMERVEGWAGALTDDDTLNTPPFDKMPYKYGVTFAMIDALVRLSKVDYRAIGLEDFGKPEGFLDRQVDRWLDQLKSYKELYDYPGRDIPGFDYVVDWLRANQPGSFVPGIMHGDVGLPNALFAPDPPARVVALIDWELATIGDPLLDLGGFVHSMRDEREPGRVPRHGTVRVDDYPTRQELARYYSAGTGWNPEALDYYMILAIFKNACIVEYKVAQAAKGILPEATGRFFSDLVLRRIAEAERIARISDGVPVSD